MTTAFDYSSLKTTADQLLERFGKPITLSRAARGADLDPWEQDQGPASSTAAQSITGLFGVQIALDKETLTLQRIERPLGRFVFQASTAIPEEVGPEWILSTGSSEFQIERVKPVEPGSTLLVYFAVVAL
jgi:hypothetical protein